MVRLNTTFTRFFSGRYFSGRVSQHFRPITTAFTLLASLVRVVWWTKWAYSLGKCHGNCFFWGRQMWESTATIMFMRRGEVGGRDNILRRGRILNSNEKIILIKIL